MKPYKILQSFKGSQDGIRVEDFEEGQIKDLSDSLSDIAITEGWAEPASEGDEPKSIAVAPENKAAQPVKATKKPKSK